MLARAQDLTADQPLHPLRMLNGLRQRYNDCYAFSIANGQGQSLIGASPERLVKCGNGEVVTEALDAVNKTGARLGEAGVYVLKGELTLQQFKVQSSKSPTPNPQSLTPKP